MNLKKYNKWAIINKKKTYTELLKIKNKKIMENKIRKNLDKFYYDKKDIQKKNKYVKINLLTNE
jgi:hypothetical protein